MDCQGSLADDELSMHKEMYDVGCDRHIPYPTPQEDRAAYEDDGSCLTCPFRAYVKESNRNKIRRVRRTKHAHQCHHANRNTRMVYEWGLNRGDLKETGITFGSNPCPKGEKSMPCKGYIAALKATKGQTVILL